MLRRELEREEDRARGLIEGLRVRLLDLERYVDGASGFDTAANPARTLGELFVRLGRIEALRLALKL